ncbi:hypothetical protein K435DRAFT_857828 [Dendrothele bispora CBS 962.96]|uniref:Fungal-type protein kinase domain-containing protein n=1 Tax=Dendrothele bispora (strain CBS 962.96) TaxID=1314807 RepID=A0A4S8M5Y0_DENBC|nr:hypothetical protein K435DRAFT_857828 [Dendrothele bispora CBS 962.96]
MYVALSSIQFGSRWYLCSGAALGYSNVLSAYEVDDQPPMTCVFKSRPHNPIKSEITGSSFKVDTVCKLRTSRVPTPNPSENAKEDWYSSDIVANFEYDLRIDDLRLNRRRLIGAVGHYMRNDPCRLFMYSLSIEGDAARLWFFSRSHSVRSRAFNAKMETRPLIRFIVAMLFGTLEQLGFDPSTTRMRDDKGIYYVYQVNEGYYRTLGKPLSDYYASCISGRATRVWLVQQCDEDGRVFDGAENHVLKDCWSKENYTERAIQQAIFGRLDGLREHVDTEFIPSVSTPESPALLEPFAFPPPPALDCLPDDKGDRDIILTALKNYKDYFVTILDEEILLHNTPDAHPNGIQCYSDDGYNGQWNTETSIDQTSFTPQTFTPKSHCRIIYKELCQPIDELTDVEEIADTLHDCVIALHLLYLVGYIHRDISVGNVLHYSVNNRGMLSDFEYAREFHREDAATDPKIGTPAFMAVDIQQGFYTMWQYKPGSIVPKLCHNYLHDLESVLWLALWLFSSKTQVQPQDLKQHRGCITALFGGNWEVVNTRQKIMRMEDKYDSRSKKLLLYTFPPSDSTNSEGFNALLAFYRDQQGYALDIHQPDKIDDDRVYRNCFKVPKETFRNIKTHYLGLRIHAHHELL